MTPRDVVVSRGAIAVLLATAMLFLAAACGGEPAAVALDQATPCAFCRMTVSDVHFAAQIVAAGEEPLFFDDIGCLAGYLARERPADGSVAYVADHRTGAWVRAADATFSYAPSLASPMGSHLIAHASTASRNEDRAAQGAEPRQASSIFGAVGVPGGPREP